MCGKKYENILYAIYERPLMLSYIRIPPEKEKKVDRKADKFQFSSVRTFHLQSINLLLKEQNRKRENDINGTLLNVL